MILFIAQTQSHGVVYLSIFSPMFPSSGLDYYSRTLSLSRYKEKAFPSPNVLDRKIAVVKCHFSMSEKNLLNVRAIIPMGWVVDHR